MRGITFDGGGVLGIGQAEILKRLDPVCSFDFCAGTSIGSVSAAAVASGISSTICQSLHVELPNIFAGQWIRRFKPFTPRYPDAELNRVLKMLFPGKFNEVKIPTFIVSADLNRRKIKVFDSTDKEDGQWYLWEVVRTSVAAETYFIPWKGFGDGGIFANNPAMVAVAGAVGSLKAKLEDIELVSIGTGADTENTNISKTNGWTHFHWGAYLIETMLMGAANDMHEYFVTQLPLKLHKRIQFSRKQEWTLDNYSYINDIVTTWSSDIEKAANYINRMFTANG